MLYLISSCIALLLGPIFYRFFATNNGLHKGLDGFIFVSLGGLVLVHILPELLEHGGLLAIFFVLLGLWGPTASEKIFHKYSEITHNLTLVLGIGGLLLHTLTDGGAMVLAQQEHNSNLLALGVILHRLPVGVAIWWLLKPQVGTRWASAVIASMMVLTAIGYFAGEQWLTQLSLDNTAYLQAFVTGSILHVVVHQPHGQPDTGDSGRFKYQAGVGSLLGLGLLFVLLMMDSGGHEHHHHESSYEHLIDWMLTIAPVLLLSYGIAAIRFHFGQSPTTSSRRSLWLQRLCGPEALVISLVLLGPIFALTQTASLLMIGTILTLTKAMPTDPHLDTPSSPIRFGFAHLIDRSAPWVLLSLILANLIGHPSVPLANPYAQVAILLMVFLPMRFCNLGAAVLAVALAYSGWEPIAVFLPLIAAPWLNIKQLKLLSPLQAIAAIAALLVSLYVANMWIGHWQTLFAFPSFIQVVSLSILAILFALSLLRLGPRDFLGKLMVIRGKPHDHHHDHGHHH
ncbi:metal transporter [Shewanella gelidii]|uniref:Metal transporter n=1 Tax=Shewanella gelidii TaxID=1642821 RepID=A0A917NDB3_9GAMM|nr:metal transporter [Shewanella gelidii]MCL1098930.1 metal transporter [Shewanella gelidii]GGI90046.1 metal transporter [Shewanella gelidii]